MVCEDRASNNPSHPPVKSVEVVQRFTQMIKYSQFDDIIVKLTIFFSFILLKPGTAHEKGPF
jgi:hypothetical protein